ncbi:MAG: acyl-CoA dehydrogenase family protein [Alphaproteobacteria bacterium]|uniref:acyl-CoA dehydrogenase family protein n=1 Tax=Pacificispira sp. TaxID=2888761 RepID=UPI001B0317E6|nr:acyl-CoA dehydrogenase family protein [Alphaproteobacteria bacterium]MBO6865129.1 acyl-CoA dehydrogenase family protein [Alphaproteobacteria bacterium]
MDFSITEEQKLIVETALRFVEEELYPYEEEVEKSDKVSRELGEQIKRKSLELGLYAANMPEEVGGGGLDTLSMCMLDRALGRASMALNYIVYRPSNVLQACVGDQREQYLYPACRGERVDCFAMTEPGAGSDVRGMKTFAKRDGSDFVINGVKHFISHVDWADFIILMAATGEEDSARGKRKKITTFLVDKDTPGLTVRPGYSNVSHRGYHNFILEFDDCRVPETAVLGEVDKGFDVANDWLGATRLQVASLCLGRCDRAMELSLDWAVNREQFGQKISKFQGVSFKLADMQTKLKAAELLTYEAAWKYDNGTMSDMDAAMSKLSATEALAYIADEAIQIHGGMGVMSELPLERIWRDARIERIWEGTSEIQRHIISRSLLRPLGG